MDLAAAITNSLIYNISLVVFNYYNVNLNKTIANDD